MTPNARNAATSSTPNAVAAAVDRNDVRGVRCVADRVGRVQVVDMNTTVPDTHTRAAAEVSARLGGCGAASGRQSPGTHHFRRGCHAECTEDLHGVPVNVNRNPDKSSGTAAEPGWRHAPGDSDDTVRYWDGVIWWGEPVERFDSDAGRGRLVVDDAISKVPEPATLFSRAFATALDVAIVAAVTYAAVIAAVLPEPVDPSAYTPQQYLDMLVSFSAWVLIVSLIWATLDTLSTFATGRSPGKLIAGVRCVTTGTRDTPRKAATLKRAIIKCCAWPLIAGVVYSSVTLLSLRQQPGLIAAGLVVALGAAVPLASVRRRALWDVAAGTEVIDPNLR